MISTKQFFEKTNCRPNKFPPKKLTKFIDQKKSRLKTYRPKITQQKKNMRPKNFFDLKKG